MSVYGTAMLIVIAQQPTQRPGLTTKEICLDYKYYPGTTNVKSKWCCKFIYVDGKQSGEPACGTKCYDTKGSDILCKQNSKTQGTLDPGIVGGENGSILQDENKKESSNDITPQNNGGIFIDRGETGK